MKTLITITTVSFCLALVFLIPSKVIAEDIEIRFVAEIDSIETDSDAARTCLGLEVGDGTTITGNYIYGTDAVEMDLDPDKAHYEYDTPPYGMQLKVGEYEFQTDPNDFDMSLFVYDKKAGEGVDGYGVVARTTQSVNNDISIEGMYTLLIDSTGTASDGTVVPTDAPTLSYWDTHQITLDFSGCESYPCSTFRVLGHVTSMERVFPLNDLLDALEALIDSAALDAQQELGLYLETARAIANFDRGRMAQACEQFQAFLCQLEALLPMFDSLYADDAADILEQATEIFAVRCADESVLECPMGDDK